MPLAERPFSPIIVSSWALGCGTVCVVYVLLWVFIFKTSVPPSVVLAFVSGYCVYALLDPGAEFLGVETFVRWLTVASLALVSGFFGFFSWMQVNFGQVPPLESFWIVSILLLGASYGCHIAIGR